MPIWHTLGSSESCESRPAGGARSQLEHNPESSAYSPVWDRVRNMSVSVKSLGVRRLIYEHDLVCPALAVPRESIEIYTARNRYSVVTLIAPGCVADAATGTVVDS